MYMYTLLRFRAPVAHSISAGLNNIVSRYAQNAPKTPYTPFLLLYGGTRLFGYRTLTGANPQDQRMHTL